MTALVLRLPLPPPLSACFKNAQRQKRINGKLRKWSGRVKTARYIDWIAEAVLAVTAQCGPLVARANFTSEVHVDYQFGKPDRRRQDAFNREKAVSDLLVRVGILADDSLISDGRCRWAKVEGVVVTIWPARWDT